MKGLSMIASAIKSSSSKIDSATTFVFVRKVGDNVMRKHAIATSKEETMYEIMKRSYLSDASGVFCFSSIEETDFKNKLRTLRMQLTNDSIVHREISFIKRDFDRETVGNLVGVVNDNVVEITLSIVDIPPMTPSVVRGLY